MNPSNSTNVLVLLIYNNRSLQCFTQKATNLEEIEHKKITFMPSFYELVLENPFLLIFNFN